jgi:peptidoglycan/LPS O-acetylase OafA/YrhL
VSGINSSHFSGSHPGSTVAVDPTAVRVSETPRPTTQGRVLSCILALIVGAVFGAVGTVAHQSTLNLGALRIPLGLPLALIGVLALLLGFRLLLRDRLVVFLAAVGVVAVIALFSVPSPGGSVLIPQGLLSIIWTIGPVLIATVVVAWPRLPERVHRAEPPVGSA